MLVLCAIGGCARTVPYHPDQQLRAQTFDFYWNYINEHHPYLDSPGVDWHAAKKRFREPAVQAPSTLKYYAQLELMFNSLKDPHTRFQSKRFNTLDPSNPGGVWNLDLQTINVQRVEYLYAWPGSQGCLPATDSQYPQILRVGSVPVTDFVPGGSKWVQGEEALPIVVEYPDSSLLTIEASAPRELMQEFPTGVFYHSGYYAARYPFMADTPLELPQAVYQAPIYLHTSGYTLLASEHPLDHPFAHLSRTENRDRKSLIKPWWINWKDLGPVRYIRISTLDDESREDGIIDRDVSGWIDVACHNIHRNDKVIIDLRYNGGGNAKYVERVLGYFVREPFKIIFDERKEYFGLVKYITGFRVVPRTPNFKGQIVVLINQGSASAAEWLAASLQNLTNATLIGETTVGAESPTTVVTGPDGSTLNTSMKYKYPMPFAGYQRFGITPDVQVPLTIQRVREIGLAEATRETEINQVKAAGEALGVDLTAYLRVY